MLTVLFSFGQFFADMNFVVKIFLLLTIISFVRNHIENPTIQVIVVILLGWFIFFDLWRLFGGIYVLYLALMMGISQFLVDLFFVGSMMSGQQPPQAHDAGPAIHTSAVMPPHMAAARMAGAGKPRPPPMG